MRKQKGISLIVLIITIIVVIILAAVVILTLSKNNPVESAKEATFKEDVRTFQDELAMYIAKDYTAKAGARDDKITATTYDKIKDYIPSFSKKYEGKFIIKNDELKYDEETVVGNEKEWCKSLNVKANAKTGAEKAKEKPSDYYGEVVNYTTGNEDIDDDIPEWKIFYSDGSNVYIISSSYVHPDYLPSKGTGTEAKKPDQGDATNYPRAARFNNNILSKYSTGSVGITDEKMKAFNSDYYAKEYTSGNKNNFKAVAYMLDKDIWRDFANSSVAEYAVGGPSVEMLLKSYSEKKNVDFRAQASSATGYQVSNNGGTSYANYISGMLSTSESLYVLPQSSTGSGANAMWLASPSANNGNSVMYVDYGGGMGNSNCNTTTIGFRPLVCLNSNILLNWNDQTKKYDIE